MNRYELKLKEGGKGVFKVSVVKDPAIESNLVYFSKEAVTVFKDEEKRVIYSVVMRPDLDIFRSNIDGAPANVYYTKETVEEAQINYFRNNGNSATNINHSDVADAKGIFPFESWIVKDAKTDRANNFGLEVKEGDWVMGLKVDNDELWEEHIKTGKLDGLSVEATNINYELKQDEKMSKETIEEPKKTLLEKLDDLLSTFKKQEKVEFTEDTKESTKEAPKSNDEVSKLKEEITTLKAELASLKAKETESKTDLEKMTSEKEALEVKLTELSKVTPAAEFVKDLPKVEKKEYKDMSNYEKVLFNRENSRY